MWIYQLLSFRPLVYYLLWKLFIDFNYTSFFPNLLFRNNMRKQFVKWLISLKTNYFNKLMFCFFSLDIFIFSYNYKLIKSLKIIIYFSFIGTKYLNTTILNELNEDESYWTKLNYQFRRQGRKQSMKAKKRG